MDVPLTSYLNPASLGVEHIEIYKENHKMSEPAATQPEPAPVEQAMSPEYDEEQQNARDGAAITIQKEWRSFKERTTAEEPQETDYFQDYGPEHEDAAKAIQSGWRQRSSATEPTETENFQEYGPEHEDAAKKIQSGWRQHASDTEPKESEEFQEYGPEHEEAAKKIQSGWRQQASATTPAEPEPEYGPEHHDAAKKIQDGWRQQAPSMTPGGPSAMLNVETPNESEHPIDTDSPGTQTWGDDGPTVSIPPANPLLVAELLELGGSTVAKLEATIGHLEAGHAQGEPACNWDDFPSTFEELVKQTAFMFKGLPT